MEEINSNKKIVINFFEEVYNNRKFNIILYHFSENYYEHRDDGARSNRDALNITEMACSIFPDLHVEIKDIIAEDDLVSIRLGFSGTHKGEYINIEPTNKFIEWEAMEFFKLKDGVITESWGSWPNYDILLMLNK